MKETAKQFTSSEKRININSNDSKHTCHLRTLSTLPRINLKLSSSSAPILPRIPIEREKEQINFAEMSILAKNPINTSTMSQSENNLIYAEINDRSQKKNKEQYIVQKGDTVQSIALKFDLSVNWLEKKNNINNGLIFPGDILNIAPPTQEETMKKEPIHIDLLHSNLKEKSTSGTLYLVDNTLNFQPDTSNGKVLNIDLLNHIESVIFPHPEVMISDVTDASHPDTPYIYMMSYFKDLNDKSSMSAIYFGTTFKIATQLKKLIETTALKAQKKNGITAPNPEGIPLKNDSSENLNNSTGEIPIDNSKFENYNNVDNKATAPLKTTFPPFTVGSMINIPPINSEPLPPLSEAVARRRRTLSVLPRIELIQGTSAILNEREIDELRYNFPYRCRNSDWSLLYKLSRDGSSYTTLYHLTEKASPVVLLIQTNAGEKIGAYISSGLKFSKRYYGNGEIFVFRFTPKLEVFRWAHGSNQYFVSSSKDDISIGGGGHSAIWIDGRLMNAVSEPCPTFNSPQLTKDSHFLCYDIEVWRIGEKSRRF